MAVGLPASHTETFAAVPSPALQAAFAAAARALGWAVGEQHGLVTAATGVSLWSWGERVTVHLHTEDVTVTSRCAMPLQAFDWGRNAQNVRALLARVGPLPAPAP